MRGTGVRLHAARKRFLNHIGAVLTCIPPGIHRPIGRREQDVHPCSSAKSSISLEIPWIPVQVFIGTELRWVDVDAQHDDAFSADLAARDLDEAKMAFVEITHGGNQPYGQPLPSP